MSWMVLVRINSEHNEFWSAEKVGDRFTGKVVYGRNGTTGRVHIYHTSREVRDKSIEKLQNGYYVIFRNSDYPNPTSSDISFFRERGNLPLDRGEEENQPERQPRVRRARRRTIISPSNIPKYKTNKEGYIKKFREGYVRIGGNSYSVVAKEEIYTDRNLLNKIKKFYESIPSTAVIKKQPFGNEWDSDEIFGRRTGQYRFVINNHGKVVGGFEIFRSTGESYFFYIKTNSRNYQELVNFMVYAIAPLTDADIISIRTKGAILKRALENVIDWDSKTTRNKITIWEIKKSKIISQSNTVDRFQELIF